MAKAAPPKKTSAKPVATPSGKRVAPVKAGSVPERKAGSVPERKAGSVPERKAGSKAVIPVKAAAGKQRTAAKAPAKASGAKKATAKPAAKVPAKSTATAKAKAPPAKKAAAMSAKAKAPVAKKAASAPAKAKTVAKPAPAPKPVPVKKKSTVTCPLSGFEVKPDKPNLSPRTVERLRLKLLEERARHVHQADELQAEAESLANDREGGDTQFDEESGEGDTFNVERERDLLLSATARQIVDEIDHALERIKDKTYGVCVPAGRRISLERLDALPYAETCVECKARAERRR